MFSSYTDGLFSVVGWVFFFPPKKGKEVEISSKLITDFGPLADGNEESHGQYSKEGDFPHLQNRNDGN